MLYNAFQTGFQAYAFQLTYPAFGNIAYGGRRIRQGDFHGHDPFALDYELRLARKTKLAEEQRAAEYKIRAKEQEIAELERQRLDNLADTRMQMQLLALLNELDLLELERLRLQGLIMAFLRDEEDMMVLLLTMPFV